MAAKQPAKRKNVKKADKASTVSASRKANTEKAGTKKKSKRHHWLRWVIGALVLALALVIAAFSWDRWFRYDDAQDIRGEWQASGQAAVAVIDGSQIHLTDEVAYAYTLNTWDKTIEFTFGKLSNTGTYEFSEDRRTLVIVEGGTSDLIGDFFAMFGVTGKNLETSDMPTTVLIKLSDAADSQAPAAAHEPAPEEATDPPADDAAVEQASPPSESGDAGSDSEESGEDAPSSFGVITDRSGPE